MRAAKDKLTAEVEDGRLSREEAGRKLRAYAQDLNGQAEASREEARRRDREDRARSRRRQDSGDELLDRYRAAERKLEAGSAQGGPAAAAGGE